MVENNPPDMEKDMSSHAELNLSVGKPPCSRVALSVFQDLNLVRQYMRASRRWRDAAVAKANLQPSHGQISDPDHKSHCNFWLRRTAHAQACTLFQVIP